MDRSSNCVGLLQEELERGSQLADRLNLFPGQNHGPLANWPELWEPATFFSDYRNYLQVSC